MGIIDLFTKKNNMYCTKCGLKNEDNENFCLFKV